MKVLIDTNVLFDVLAKREPFYLDSARIWTLINRKIIEGFLSAISINNLYYIIRKLRGHKSAVEFVDQILEDFEIVALTKTIFKQARTAEGKDFEDLIQYFSAIHEGCEILVTRNKKHFLAGGLSILTPPELLKRLE